jgi:phenylpropionate dioxygenase-like ring-hydroxylating dioxygenase large terminal subunit
MNNGTTTQSNRSRWHDTYPHLGTAPLPADVFTSAERFARERERIFKKVWLNVGRVEQLPHPGSYFMKDLPICNTSIIVVRGKDGTVHAFHNICSHRGNKIVWDNGGTCRMFTCKFHGWSYGLNGKLTFVPDEERFLALPKETLGLTPVAVDVWEGFIFINVDPNPQETLQEYVGELGAELAGYPFGEFSATWRSWTTEVKSNWKVLKDAFQEAYHAPFLHHRSLPDVASKTNPYLRALDMRLYSRHGRMSVDGNPESTPKPVAALAYRHGDLLIRNDFSDARLPPGVNPTRSPAWTIDVNVIFPAFFVDVSAGSYFTHQFWPIAVDRTIWQATQYFPKAKTPGQRFSQEYGHVLFRDVVSEDARPFEEAMSVLASGAKTAFYMSDEEILVRHSHHVIEQMSNGQPVTAVAPRTRTEDTAHA